MFIIRKLKLDSLSPSERELAIGDTLFPLVAVLEDEYPGRITGILMECCEVDVLKFIADPRLLKLKVNEVRSIIAKYNGNNNSLSSHGIRESTNAIHSMAPTPGSSWASHEFDDPPQRTSDAVIMGDHNNDQQES